MIFTTCHILPERIIGHVYRLTLGIVFLASWASASQPRVPQSAIPSDLGLSASSGSSGPPYPRKQTNCGYGVNSAEKCVVLIVSTGAIDFAIDQGFVNGHTGQILW